MLKLAIFFFLMALIAAVLGYGGLVGEAVGTVKRAYFLFTLLFMITAIGRAMRNATVPKP